MNEEEYRVIFQELSKKAQNKKVGIAAFFQKPKSNDATTLKSSLSLPMNNLEVSTDRVNNNIDVRKENDHQNIEDRNVEEIQNENGEETYDSYDDENMTRTKPFKAAFPAPAQEKLKNSISEKEKYLNSLYEAQATGLSSGSSAMSLKTLINETQKDLKKDKADLKKKEADMKSSRKARKSRAEKWSNLEKEHPELMLRMKAKPRPGPGRPRIEDNQPELLNEILKIATIGAACGDRRREDIFRTVKTLDDLHAAVTNLGFEISRSGLYLKLRPRDATSIQGKKHVNTVNVRLVRPQNDLRKKHPDRIFAAATSKGVDELAAHLGNDACTFLGQDDKAAVAIGKTAAKVQTPLLMNMNVRVRIADHDFVVGSKHYLCPSVMAKCEIDPKTGVTYSGPTYVAIRSSKHNNSTASSHHVDLWRFVALKPEAFHNSSGDFKPVLIKQVDGGPDENPRYEKNKVMAMKTFQDKNLDCIIEVCQAPGLSAFGRAERRMFPLSKELSGVVLPADHYGSHLKNGETIDPDLELQNFQFAGETLAEIWSRLEIDGEMVTAEYMTDVASINFSVSPAWRDRHLFESQYLSAVLKCDDKTCCEELKTDVDCFFPSRRLPIAIPLKYGTNGLVAVEPFEDYEKQDLKFLDLSARVVTEKRMMPENMTKKFNNNVPYDAFLPSLQEKLNKRICVECHKYFSAVKSMTEHKKICKRKRKNKPKEKTRAKKAKTMLLSESEDKEEEPEAVELSENEAEAEESLEIINLRGKKSVSSGGFVERILDLKEWMKSPWIEDK